MDAQSPSLRAHRIRPWAAAMAMAGLFAAGPACASPVVDQIRNAARAFLERHTGAGEGDDARRVSIQIGQLDPRLQLQRCAGTPQVTPPRSGRRQGRITVKVSCRDPRTWSIYVPAQIKIYQRVVVSKRPIPRDTQIREAQLKLAEKEVSGLRQGYYTAIDKVAGWVARRSLPASQALTPNAVEQPLLVNRGDRVLIKVRNGRLSVQAKGEALEDGARGDRIRVRNRSSDRVVEGTVKAPGEVQVSL